MRGGASGTPAAAPAPQKTPPHLPERPVVADAPRQRRARLPPLPLAAAAAPRAQRQAARRASGGAAAGAAGAGAAAGRAPEVTSGGVELRERLRRGERARERGAAAGVKEAALQLQARQGGEGEQGARQLGRVAAACGRGLASGKREGGRGLGSRCTGAQGPGLVGGQSTRVVRAKRLTPQP